MSFLEKEMAEVRGTIPPKPTTEERLAALESRADDLQRQVDFQQDEINDLRDRIYDLENDGNSGYTIDGY